MDRLGEFDTARADAGYDTGGNSACVDADAGIEAPPSVGSDERRMHVRAYNYWVSLLKGRAFPSVEDLDLDESADFGPHGVLIDFTVAAASPAIAWLGGKLRAECDLPDGATTLAGVPPRSLLSRLTDHHLQIIANGAPIGFEAEFVNARGNTAMYRGILLPFSSDNDTIDFIYGVINWKEAAPAALTAAISAAIVREATAADTAAETKVAPGGPQTKRPTIAAWADGPSGSVRRAITDGASARLATLGDEPTVDVATGKDTNDEDEDTDDVDSGAAADADMTLADRLAAARDTADAARNADVRGRAALYKALAEAYDFAMMADERSAEYARLLADGGIARQARAPMTPIAKLIFGRDYDKTRLTEFSAALGFAKRRGLPPGGMKLFLENFPGGLKAVVAAERRERRPAGKPERPDATRERARALEAQAMLSLGGDDEFVVLVARRIDGERVAIIGVVPDDRPLLDRALRQIVAD